MLIDILISAFLVISGIFGLVGSFGLIKLPDPMMRLHAPTKATTLGVGGALIGSLTSFISVPLSYFVGLFFNDTLIPLVAGFTIFGSASLFCTWMGLNGFVEE